MVQVQWYGGEGVILSLQSELRRLLARSGALSALMMDSAGRLLTMVGNDIPQFDVTSFVSLSASDFAATRELARLLGETTFQDLFHQGDSHGLYMTQVREGMLLAVLFDRTTTLGLVRHAIRKARPRVQPILDRSFTSGDDTVYPIGATDLSDLSREIDSYFDDAPPDVV